MGRLPAVILVLGLAFPVISAEPAYAAACRKSSWMDSLPGFGNDGCTHAEKIAAARRERRERAASQPADDLRKAALPMISRAMLDALEGAIGRYQKVVASGGWPSIPKGRYIRPGADDERVPRLRQRLLIAGDLHPKAGARSTSYDQAVEDAVKRFQKRHGIRVSGIVDTRTMAHLNVSAADRLQQLKTNHRRLAGYVVQPQEPRYVFVNIPSFQLDAIDNGQITQSHRVIVGKPDRQTPELKVTIRGLNFFPYWRVPDSVAHKDLIPRLIKEPDYLDKEYIRVLKNFGGEVIDPRSVDWRSPDALQLKFRQDPGPHNALGLVRIDMPNEHIVYMHDTPMKTLFNQQGRSFSAGCVRVQGVFDLAQWIAQSEPGWDKTRFDSVLQAGIAEDLKLSKRVPVIFAYLTAWAEPTGPVQFRYDIYGRDGAAADATLASDDDDAPPPQKQLLSP